MEREIELIETLKRQEGFREKPYQDSLGVWTIGYGFTSLSQDEAEAVLKIKVEKIRNTLKPLIQTLSDTRQDVLINMAYNLGTDGLLKFRRMWCAIYRRDFVSASKEILDSLWASQVGGRAASLAKKMRTG